jgi:hypothetical protein
MSVETVVPERLAKLVHHYREALASDFGCQSNATPDWEDLSPEERSRMVAATRLALLDLRSAHPPTPGDSLPHSMVGGGSEGKECGC